jgi:hypothetical protein
VIFSGDSSFVGVKYTIVNDIVPGQEYQYKLRAFNKWGASEFSPLSDAILAATVPDRVEIPTTSIDSETGSVKITWVAPYENGAVIDAYQVEVTDSNGLW